LTVGTHSGQDQGGEVTVRDGRFRIERGYDPPVRMPDDVLKCVGYVCEVTHRDATGAYGDAYATGFFIAVPCESQELKEKRFTYFVTAKHVATDLEHREIFFLVNKKGGGSSNQTTVIGDRWHVHPTDAHADVAIIQVGIHPSADIMPVAIEYLGLPEKLKTLTVGIGDETYTVGLFSAVPGDQQNMPVVRCGNIAMMPTEQIRTELGYTDVYLVEARSIGGMSGSPTFVQPTVREHIKLLDGTPSVRFSKGPAETLLGMMQAHWSIRESEINSPSFTHDRQRGVNYGIAVVVPAFKIYETIYKSDLVAMRKEQEEKELRRTVPSSDRLDPKEEPTFTKEDFETALKKVSRKIERGSN
jgi:hypothetical protein